MAEVDFQDDLGRDTEPADSSPDDVDRIVRAADSAAGSLLEIGTDGRARLLRAMAGEIEGDADAIVEIAEKETALGPTRLLGEVTRTCFQLRFFADVVSEGSYIEATIDHEKDAAMGSLADLRRMLVPLGPVAVFGASNFPLAFSVPGQDTASAIAAGCPVVAKAHPAHPETSERAFAALRRAAASCGAAKETFGLVFGLRAGADLVRHRVIRAVGFTGSQRAGRALFDLASARPDPIPFYGELGSVNPVVVTPAARASVLRRSRATSCLRSPCLSVSTARNRGCSSCRQGHPAKLCAQRHRKQSARSRPAGCSRARSARCSCPGSTS